MRVFGAHILAAALWLCATLVAPPANAGRDDADILSVASRLPDDVDFLLVISHAAEHRTSEAGPALAALMETVLANGEAFKKWAEFSRSLAWNEQEAFDELLGRRFAIVGRGVWTDRPSWALLTEVDAEADKRLRRKLAIAPRGIVARHTLYAVENGHFVLTTEPRKGGATVLVAPADGAELFDEIVSRLGEAQAKSLSSLKAIREISALREGEGHRDAKAQVADVLLYFRLPEPTSGWAGLAGWREGATLRTQVLARPGCNAELMTPWPLSQWGAIDEDALLCVLERRPKQSNDKPGVAPQLIDLPWIAADPATEAALGNRNALVIRADPAGGVSLTGALELQSLGRSAAAADGVMRDLLTRLSARLSVGAWKYDFEGLFPDATRVVDLSPPGGPTFPFIGGEGCRISWLLRPDGVAPGERAWLVAGTRRALVEQTAEALAQPPKIDGPHDECAMWITVGVVRPAMLREALLTARLPLPPPADALAWIDRIEWQVRIVDQRQIRGEAVVTLTPKN